MSASFADLERWFDQGVAGGNTHMIVVTDTYSNDNFPVYVDETQDAWAVYHEYSKGDFQRVEEVYDLLSSKAFQMSERYAFHLPLRGDWEGIKATAVVFDEAAEYLDANGVPMEDA